MFNKPGTLTWNELQSRDIDAAREFYAQVLGWQWMDGPSDGYWIGTLPDKPGEDKSNCGAMAMPPGCRRRPQLLAGVLRRRGLRRDHGQGPGVGRHGDVPGHEDGAGNLRGLIDPTGAAFAVGAFG